MKSLLAAALPCLMFAALTCAADAPSPADSAVARIGAKEIPFATLEGRVHDTLAQQQRQHDLQLQQLNTSAARARSTAMEVELGKLVDDQVLALEAAARKKTPAELLSAIKAPPPSDAEMHALYDSERSRLNQPFDAVRAQIIEYLRGVAGDEAQRKYLDGLRQRYHAVLLWEPLRETVETNGPQRGPADARVTIVEFSDFQCPFCGRLAPVLKQLQAAYPADVRLVFRNFPLRTLHPNAQQAAQAGVCADAQGKFWQMHDAMYADQKGLGPAGLEEKAQSVGLDAQVFGACLNASPTSEVIAADEQAAEQLGLSGTPGSFVNGRFVNGALPLSEWRGLVDDELRRAGGPTRTAAR
jgi:protein-disulfide isomerase